MKEHIVASFDEELSDLSQKIAEMGGIAEQQVANSVAALARRDGELAQTVIASDRRMDQLQREIEDRATLMIAKRQPMAQDLREIVAAIHIANDLERVGDLAKNTAKRVFAIENNFGAQRLVAGVEHIAELSFAQLKNVLDAYATPRSRRGPRRVGARRRDRRDVHLAVPRAPHLHDGGSAQHHLLHRISCSAPRTSSGSATTPPTSPRPSTTWSPATAHRRAAEEGHHQHHAGGVRAEVAMTAPVDSLPSSGSRTMRSVPVNRCVRSARIEVDRAMTPRVMIVEDEEPLSLMLRYNLEAEGYQVDTVERGDDAETRLRENIPDLLLLDWMLPGVSGIELCRRLRTREQTRSLPIIMLTARGEEQERVRGLATGADDYVVKPFSVPELMARVRAILRRSRPELIASVLRAGDIELDRETHRVRRKGRELHLGPTEFRLLEFLMQAPGRVFSRAQLLDGVWGRDVYVDERTVDVHVGRLRKALGPGRDPIRTVRGSGYSLDEAFTGVA